MHYTCALQNNNNEVTAKMHTSKDSATSWQTEEQNAPNFTAQDCNTKTSTIQNYSDFAGEHILKIQLQFFCLVLHNNVTQENFANIIHTAVPYSRAELTLTPVSPHLSKANTWNVGTSSHLTNSVKTV